MTRRRLVMAAAMSLFGAGCLGELGADESTSLTAGALDNQTGVADGVACYQDVPMRKGKMEMGVCCFDDPIAGTSECIICDAAHKCTPGGAEPGALTAEIKASTWGGANAVLEPLAPPPRPLILGSASSARLSTAR
jgi:hypothetical protein